MYIQTYMNPEKTRVCGGEEESLEIQAIQRTILKIQGKTNRITLNQNNNEHRGFSKKRR